MIAYFSSHGPTLRYSLLPLLVLAFILYTRHPSTNYIFDEQEALLANPYVNATQGLTFWDAIHRDFWGLPPDGSIGSYR
ncbi:MAG: tetratricopeptide repeat protein, partial [Deltaproteobacteria bacterium]|nr:tetratricopeptide repeat protein [Deltaproteobacteria bacterium]